MNITLLNRINWLLAGLLACVFFAAGLAKLAGVDMLISQFLTWGYPEEMRYAVGLLEICLAIGLLWPHFRFIAIYEIFFWSVGAVLTHLQSGQWEQVGVPLLLAGINSVLLLIDHNQITQFSGIDRHRPKADSVRKNAYT
jgi:putative oxidoreductase